MGSAPESLSQFWDERWLRNDQCFRGQWLPQVHDVFCSGCLWVTALLRHYFNVNSADKNAQFWLSVEEFPLQYQNSFILAECICFLSKEGVAYCWRTPVVENNFQQYWGIGTLLNREVFTSLPTSNVRVHSQYFAELSTTSAFSSYPEYKIMLTYIICYSALISVGKYLRGNPDFLKESTANGIVISWSYSTVKNLMLFTSLLIMNWWFHYGINSHASQQSVKIIF